MNCFPEKTNVKYKNEYVSIYFDTKLNDFRKDIFDFLINRSDENEYHDLDIWCRNHIKNNIEMMSSFVDTITKELIELGWNCKTSFNDTGLFIYSSINPPPSCW